MQQKNNLLVNEHLLSLKYMKEAETDAFFYTRLKARMERENESIGWDFQLKPVWLIGMMSFLLLINVLMITAKNNSTKVQTEETPSLKSFAASYDQSISSF